MNYNFFVCVHVFVCLHLFNRATLVSELVKRGEKMLRDGLESANSNPSKLNDSICAQLCDAGLEALAKATRYNSFLQKLPANCGSFKIQTNFVMGLHHACKEILL